MPVFEVTGTYTITVAARVKARDEEHAMEIASNICNVQTEYNGSSVFLYGKEEGTCLCADGEIEWNSVEENGCVYVDEEEVYEEEYEEEE